MDSIVDKSPARAAMQSGFAETAAARLFSPLFAVSSVSNMSAQPCRGRMPMVLAMMPIITSSAPPPIELSRLSRQARLTRVSSM